MTSDVNWGLVIAAGVIVGLLILVLIAGLYLLLSPPPVSEPLGAPDGMLADSRPGTLFTSPSGLAAAGRVRPPVQKGHHNVAG